MVAAEERRCQGPVGTRCRIQTPPPQRSQVQMWRFLIKAGKETLCREPTRSDLKPLGLIFKESPLKFTTCFRSNYKVMKCKTTVKQRGSMFDSSGTFVCCGFWVLTQEETFSIGDAGAADVLAT